MFNEQFLREEAHKNCVVIQYLPDSLLHLLTKVLVLALTVSILLLLLLVAAVVRFPRCFPAALSFPLWRSPYQSSPIHDINFQTCETTLFYWSSTFPPYFHFEHQIPPCVGLASNLPQYGETRNKSDET